MGGANDWKKMGVGRDFLLAYKERADLKTSFFPYISKI